MQWSQHGFLMLLVKPCLRLKGRLVIAKQNSSGGVRWQLEMLPVY